MDIAGLGPYIYGGSGDKVRRADIWRLLYLPPVIEDNLYYNSRPFTPQAPFGSISMRNCVFRVNSYLRYTRYHLEYRHQNQELKDGSIIKDQGFDKVAVQRFPEEGSPKIELTTSTEFPKKPLNQEASQEVLLNIFRWVIINGEGIPPEEVYKDKWVQVEDDSDGESDTANDDNSIYYVSDKQRNGLEEQLSGVGEPYFIEV